MIFIDTSYFIAVARQKDQWHKKTREINSQLKNKNKITSTYVLSEVLTHIGSRSGGKKGIFVYDYIKKTTRIINPTTTLLENSLTKYLMYNGTLSFVDSVSLEIMESQGIIEIVSFDSDFDKVNGIKRIH